LIESTLMEDRNAAADLIESVLPHAGNSLRIGISGIPGVGKSTFIESFGLHLIETGKKVAVLAVDPSSPIAGGSILGDKTRMPDLSRSDHAFIRPSPTSGTTGGISQKTRESILLCEANGYNVILVETVGVGQVEVDVHGMVDFFMILMVPNAGDDLQGIKRGITELVDGIVINKADGESVALAARAKQHYQSALNILRGDHEHWKPRVLTCSALERDNLDDIWQMIEDYSLESARGNYFSNKRVGQNVDWMKKLISAEIQQRLKNNERTNALYPELEASVVAGHTTPLRAAAEIVSVLFGDEPIK
jgi:LAO/AO transport system kinase